MGIVLDFDELIEKIYFSKFFDNINSSNFIEFDFKPNLNLDILQSIELSEIPFPKRMTDYIRLKRIGVLQDLLNISSKILIKNNNIGTNTINESRAIIVNYVTLKFKQTFKTDRGFDDINEVGQEKSENLEIFSSLFGENCILEFKQGENPLELDWTMLPLPARIKGYIKEHPQIRKIKDIISINRQDLMNSEKIGRRSIEKLTQILQSSINIKPVNNLDKIIETEIGDKPIAGGIISMIDQIEKFIPERHFTVLLLRWRKDRKKSLEEIATEFNLTRERIRQIIKVSLFKISKNYKLTLQKLKIDFAEKLVNNPKPITFLNLIDQSTEKALNKYSPSFYTGLLSELLPQVPFEGYMMKSFEQKLNRIKGSKDKKGIYFQELQNMDLPFGQITVSELLKHFNISEYDTETKLELLYTILGLHNFYFVQYNKQFYLIRNSSLKRVVKDILLSSNSALEIDEIRELIKKYYTLTSNYESRVSIISNINQDSEIFSFGRSKFGLLKHFSYNKNMWNDILEIAESFMLGIKRQVNVVEVLDHVKIQFPKLLSKYELVHLLRVSPNIIDLGFFNFCHFSLNIEERSKISDIIGKIFTLTPRVYHIDEIIHLIKEIRFTRTEGMGVLLNGIDYLESYKVGYFGRKDLHNKNLEELSSNADYISKVITNQLYPNTTIDDIRFRFNDFNIEKIFQTISNSDKFFVKDINNSGNDLVFVKFWSSYKLLKFLLYNINDGLFKDEINWYFKEMDKSIEEIAIYKLKRYGMKYKDDKYFLEEDFNVIDDEDIINIVYYIIKDASSMLMIDDVYNELKEYDKSIMLSKEDLEYQLRIDKRFILTDNNLVIIYE